MLPLNSSQQKAVEFSGGPLLIVAGPGTGKTFTLTHRIARTVAALPVGRQALAVTFTNKAAAEMRDRLARMGVGEERVFAGTFHQFCLHLLRSYGEAAGLPEWFAVASPEEVQEYAKTLWPSLKARERKVRLEEVAQWKSGGGQTEEPPEAAELNRTLREHHRLDFDDLILETTKILEQEPDVRDRIQQTYPCIFVDEYQDINAAQNRLLKALVGCDSAVTAIGDPNQAIYGFRGSDAGYFERFAGDFPGAVTLSLSDNYRSAVNLLDASGQMLSGSPACRVPKLTARIYAQGRLTVHDAATEKAEAEYVVHAIERLVGGTSMFSQDSGRVGTEEEGGHAFGDIAVLYRLNSQRFALKEALERSGIPYEVSGEKNATEDASDDVYFALHTDVQVTGEKVALMTLHASKGLEFPVVFIVGCEETLLPLDLDGLTGAEEEERRLFYVGMTRAKERLYLLRARKRMLYGRARQNAPSRFLADIEEGFKEYERTAAKKKKAKTETQMDLF